MTVLQGQATGILTDWQDASIGQTDILRLLMRCLATSDNTIEGNMDVNINKNHLLICETLEMLCCFAIFLLGLEIHNLPRNDSFHVSFGSMRDFLADRMEEALHFTCTGKRDVGKHELAESKGTVKIVVLLLTINLICYFNHLVASMFTVKKPWLHE
ncbi:hypothetical protein ACJX0J_026427, partial [Zea mays]